MFDRETLERWERERDERFERKTSEGRYNQRRRKWITDLAGKEKLIKLLNHYMWWIVHNFIAHPFLAFAYKSKKAVWLHDWSSKKLNLSNVEFSSEIPVPKNIKWWVIHNLIIHPMIALIPCKLTFNWHDISAKNMQTTGWV